MTDATRLTPERITGYEQAHQRKDYRCKQCGQEWPCETVELLGHVAALDAEIEHYKQECSRIVGEIETCVKHDTEREQKDAELDRLRAMLTDEGLLAMADGNIALAERNSALVQERDRLRAANAALDAEMKAKLATVTDAR